MSARRFSHRSIRACTFCASAFRWEPPHSCGEERFSTPKNASARIMRFSAGHLGPAPHALGQPRRALPSSSDFPRTKSTVLELAHVYCTSHQSNSFAASWYRAPCSAKENLNFRSRLELEAPAAPRSAAHLNHVPTFPSSVIHHVPRKARRRRRVTHRYRPSISNRYTAIRISRKRNKANTPRDF